MGWNKMKVKHIKVFEGNLLFDQNGYDEEQGGTNRVNERE